MRRGGRVDAKVLAYVKRGTQDPTKGERRKGHPDSLGGARFFFSLGVWEDYRDGRQKLGGGVPPLQSLSAGSGALWTENVGGRCEEGVRVCEGKGENGSIRESSLCLLASGGSFRH